MTETPLSLAQHVGRRIRALREGSGVTADAVARAARAYGLSTWHRVTVSTLEAGDRGLSAEELLLLPGVLLLAGVDTEFATVSDLLPDPGARVKLSEHDSVTGRALRSLLRGEDPPRDQFDTPFVRDRNAMAREPADVTETAARKLGIEPSALDTVAVPLWGHGFFAERERRVAEHVAAGDSPRSLQARRGHAARAMYAEVADYVRTHNLATGEPRRG